MLFNFNRLKSANILLVEDEEILLNTMAKLLTNFFANVLVACNGEEALCVYEKNLVDIIITDINMPKLNGLNFVEKIREIDQKIPILFLSAYSDREKLLRAINLQVNGYLVKPASTKSLLSACDKALNKNIDDKINKDVICIFKNLQYNNITKQYLLDNQILALGARELELLNLLVKASGQTVTKDELLDILWGHKIVGTNALKSVINRLRKKIGSDYIENVKFIGWRIKI